LSLSEHILVATDLSEASFEAIRVAKSEQKLRGAKVTLLHVVEVSALAVMPVEFASPWVDVEPVVAQVEAKAKDRLAALKTEHFPDAEVKCEVLRAEVATYEEIVRYAESHAISMIVVGKHGRSGLERLILGSVTNKVIQLAPCPVLVVPVRS
jgi:nucleotide-binding universal stress UspA family protein